MSASRSPIALSAGNPMGRVLMTTLLLEVIAFALSIPVMIKVSSVDPGTAAIAGGAVAAFCAVAAGLFRTSLGYPLGWLAQLAGIALGVLTPSMFVVGIMFLALYLLSFVLGRRLDAHRRD